jgi:hypothetical protein
MRCSPTFFAALLLTVPSIAAAADADPAAAAYAIHQFRPSHVDDAFDVDVLAEQHVHHVRRVVGQAEASQDVAWSVHLVGRCTVRAVDAKGAYTAVECRVSELVTTLDGHSSPLLPVGAVIEVTVPAGGPRFRRLDGPLPSGGDRALALVLTAYPPGAPTADELYPPGRPRTVGESWPLDVAQDSALRRAAGMPAAAHVAGHATLVGRTDVAGRPCLLVKHVSDVDGPIPATRPAGVTSAHRNELSVSTATLPLDPAEPPVALVAQATVDYDVHGAVPDSGTPFDEQTHVVTDTRSTRTPARP